MHFGDNCPYYFVSFIWLSICSRQAFLLCHHRLLKFELIASAIYILKAHLHYGKKLKFQFILGNGWFHSAGKLHAPPTLLVGVFPKVRHHAWEWNTLLWIYTWLRALEFISCIRTAVLGAALHHCKRRERQLPRLRYRWQREAESIIPKGTAAA